MDANTSYQDTMTASEAIESNLQPYIRYSNKEFLPNMVDGLKLLDRRIILILNHSNIDIQKCSSLAGVVMQVYHPHGNIAIEDGIKTLGQPFKQSHTWLEIKGNFGAYGGAEPASGRYLDIKPGTFSRDMFFAGVDERTWSYIPSETGKGVEPVCMIPVVPTSLLTGGSMMSAGFRTNVPFLNFVDVCLLAEKYMNMRVKNPNDYRTKYKEIAKYCIPDFPSHSLLRNKGELLKAYASGDFDRPVIMDGTLELTPGSIVVRSIPWGTTQFEGVYEKLGLMLNSANFVSANVNEIKDLSTGDEIGKMLIRLKRNVNPFAILSNFKKILSFTQRWTPIWVFVDGDGCVQKMHPMALLDTWYKARRRCVLAGLEFQNNDLFKKWRKLSALIIIADHTDEVVNIFKTSDNKDAAVPRLVKAFSLTREQAEYLTTLQLQQITRQGKDELLKAREEVKQQMAEMQKRFVNVHEDMISEIVKVRKRYAPECPRRTRYPSFEGAVVMPDYNGVIQYSDLKEMVKIYRSWQGSSDLAVVPYNSKNVIPVDSDIETDLDLPKEFMAKDLVVVNNPRATIVLRNGKLSRIDKFVSYHRNDAICAYVSGTFIAIESGYKVVEYNTPATTKRSSPEIDGVKTNLCYVSSAKGPDVVVGFVNESAVNTVTLVRLAVGETYPEPLLGKHGVVGVWDHGEQIFVTLPVEYSSRCTVRKMLITNPDEFFGNDNEVALHFGKRRASNGKEMHVIQKTVDLLSDITIRN